MIPDVGRWPPIPATRTVSWYCPAPHCAERGFPVPVLERYSAGRWWPESHDPRCSSCGEALDDDPPWNR